MKLYVQSNPFNVLETVQGVDTMSSTFSPSLVNLVREGGGDWANQPAGKGMGRRQAVSLEDQQREGTSALSGP